MQITINKKNIVIQLITFILATIGYFIMVNYNYNNVNEVSIWIASCLGVGISIYCIYSWYLITGTVFSPYSIFLVFFILFNFGQCIMWSIGIHSNIEIGKAIMYDRLPAATDIAILKTQIYTCLSIISFHLGALLCYKDKKHYKSFSSDYYYDILFKVSFVISIIVVPMTLYRTIAFLNVAIKYGYGALYYSDHISQAGITMIAEIFFFPSLVGMLIGSKYRKKTKLFVYSILAIYFFMNFVQGDRGSWIYKIFILVWLSHNYDKNINFRKMIKLLIIAIITLYITYVIIDLRNIGWSNISLEDIKYSLSFEKSPIISAIFEMGGSMGILTVLLNIGSDIWIYSNSYLVSILGLTTTKIPQALGLDIVLIENWFSQEYLGIGWGAGFTMIGEAFLNYGLYLTPIIMCIIGYFIGSILYMQHDDKIYSPIKIFFVSTSIASLAGWSRGSSLLFLRNWFRGTVLVCLCVIFIGIMNKKIKKVKKLKS